MIKLPMAHSPGHTEGEYELIAIFERWASQTGQNEETSDGLSGCFLFNGPFDRRELDEAMKRMTGRTLTAAEHVFMRREAKAGVITYWNDQGFLWAEYFSNPKDLADAWQNIVETYAEMDREDDE